MVSIGGHTLNTIYIRAFIIGQFFNIDDENFLNKKYKDEVALRAPRVPPPLNQTKNLASTL